MRPPVTTVKMSTMRPTAASGQETFSAFEVQRDQAADEDEAKRLWTSVPGYHCHNAIDKDPRSEGDSSLRRALVLNERRTSCTVCQMRKRMIRPKSFSMNGPNGKVFFLVTFYAFAKYADKEPRLKQISTEEVKPDGIIIKVIISYMYSSFASLDLGLPENLPQGPLWWNIMEQMDRKSTAAIAAYKIFINPYVTAALYSSKLQGSKTLKNEIFYAVSLFNIAKEPTKRAIK
ncbi:uncharacterized protein LOC108158945 isoform X1 [Drosophila miranda]|uniref:uncharacterized protein LOC108158945 isoform X1 n=1 Tax=Drosophila miranda TaxID=7229 RepID=UPI0007E69604|nr:uncharacterized protein LOC108158945 isoform X1 [Drosophila miranda]